MKKHYFDAFWHEKLFKKQRQPYSGVFVFEIAFVVVVLKN
jgi:hypothetical protein